MVKTINTIEIKHEDKGENDPSCVALVILDAPKIKAICVGPKRV